MSFQKVFPWILAVGGVIGLLAAGILTVEKLHLAANPDYVPSCSISPIVACSPVIASDQASAFGFPNPIIGIAGFAMVWAVGMMLFAGAQNLKKWFWRCFQAGVTFGFLFCAWLIYQTLYSIGALCLYCMVVWGVTNPVFWTITAFNIREKHFILPKSLSNLIANHFGKAIALTYLLIIVLIITRFSDYFYTLI